MASSTITTTGPTFALYNHLRNDPGPRASCIIGGSATSPLSISDLISLSNKPEQTRQNLTSALLSKPLALASDRGSLALRETVASTYATTSGISPDNVLIANGTSGSNHVVERSLLSPADHVIVQYPIYGPSIEEPLAIGCSLSYLRSDPSKEWRIDPVELERLIQPGKTKMILLTNPGNPTGAFIDGDTQRSIIQIAQKHNIIIHTDEIFRPLFHSPDLQDQAPSFVDHADLGYDRIVVTSSMSKCYGLSGVRIGWIVTPSPSLYSQFKSYRMFSIHSLSNLDETVAIEALSPRCQPAILKKHLQLAAQNLDLIDAFAARHVDSIDWTRPRSGAVAFMKILDPNSGQPRDDVEFCDSLLKSKGVLLSPGRPCFAFPHGEAEVADEFKGRVRIHFTCPAEVLKAGLQGLTEFLAEERR